MSEDEFKMSRRAVLASALGGMTGAAAALGEDNGNLSGGTMALSEPFNVSGKLWIGPDSAKNEVAAKNGRVYMASDTDVDYYADDGSWVLRNNGSEQQPVPSINAQRASRNIGQRNANFVIYNDDGTIRAVDNNGEVQYSDTDAATVIQSAIDSLDPTDGGKLYFASGVYRISTPIEIISGLTLEGPNPDTIKDPTSTDSGSAGLFLEDGVNDNLIQYTGVDEIYFTTIRNLYLSGNSDNNTSGDVLHINDKVKDGIVENCFINRGAERGFYLGRPWNWKVVHNTIENSDVGLYVAEGSDCKIANNKMIYNGLGIEFRASGSTVTGNYLFRNERNGMKVTWGDDTTFLSNHFRANSYTNQSIYTSFQIQENVNRARVIGNTVNGADDKNYPITGIAVSPAAGNDPTDIQMWGNSITNTTVNTYDVDDGIRCVIDGQSINSGNPSTSGVWNGNAKLAYESGVTVWDTSVDPAVAYVATADSGTGHTWRNLNTTSA